MWQEETILRHPFSHERICCVGKFRDKSFADLFVGGVVLGYRQQPGQGVITVMVIWLKFESQGSIGSGLLPPTSTTHDVKPLNQKIRTRRLHDKGGRQRIIEELLCLEKLFLSGKDANQALQINQGFRVFISFFA